MQFEYIAVSAIIALGAFTQGLTGFGSALVSVPLLSMVLGAKLAIPIAGVFGWLVTFPPVWKMRSHVRWKSGGILFVGSLPGSFLGADLLNRLPAEIILVAMGGVLLASSIYSMRSSKPLFKKTTLPITLGTGFFSGALGASVGEPGPPVIAYTSMQPWSSDEVKSTLSFFFMLTMIGALAGFWHQGLLTDAVYDHVIKAAPLWALGLGAGMFCYTQLHRLNINYHQIIHGLLSVIGSTLILKNIPF